MSKNILLDGTRQSGMDVRKANVTACLAISNIVKSSLGPSGLDKMLVDKSNEVMITNDGATILQKLAVEHPAGKVLVQLSNRQDQEVGDGTTSVVIIAAELLKRANSLIKQKIHPSVVISGYRLALESCITYIEDILSISSDEINDLHLINAAKTSMSSKIIGKSSDFFAKLCVDAMKNVKTVKKDGKIIYPVKAVNILKAHGKSSLESILVNGYALNTCRASQGMPRIVKNAKIALLDFNLNRHRLKLGIKVTIKDPKELESLQQRELDITRERIQSILNSGANVIITTKGIDDVCLKYFVESKTIAIRRVSRDDLRRIAKATGGQIVLTLADLDGGENFDPSWLGHAESVSEDKINDGDIIFVKGCQKTAAQTVILRGANDYMLDEMDRSLHDSLSVVKRVLESNAVVAGGGAVESALSIHLEKFAKSFNTREQLAIMEFANSLLIIPKVLAVNADLDANDLVSQLKANHYLANNEKDKYDEYKYYGLDLQNGKIVNNLNNGVLEPTMSKLKSLRYAVEAAVSILRIDDMIQMTLSNKPGNDPRNM